MIILYVENPIASSGFYEKILGRPADEASPGFVMFHLHEALSLGLWRRGAVLPAADCGHEMVIMAPDPASVDSTHDAWAGPVLLPPTTAEFGHSFVASDPDGHRLRWLAPS